MRAIDADAFDSDICGKWTENDGKRVKISGARPRLFKLAGC